jgi:FAD/FMN-containing dehydrogenase
VFPTLTLCQVNYARVRNIPFVARSGGHSLTTSLRRIQNAILIDMRGLNRLEYDPELQQMTVAGGVSTGEFANATYDVGMEVSKCIPAFRLIL